VPLPADTLKMLGARPTGYGIRMRSWTNQKKLLTQLRRHAEKQALTDPVSAQVRAESSSSSESDTSSRRAAEFLEFAQAAGGFGVFELNLVTGHIKGTSLFFELIGLECRDMSSRAKNGWHPFIPRTWKVSFMPWAMPLPPAAAMKPNTEP
jgi:hypothetical protein